MKQLLSNFAFEADAVRQRAVSCRVRAPRGSTRRYAGYFQDFDGHLWEIAWNPQWPVPE